MTVETTPQRIIQAALELFMSHGIKKTSLEEVAHRAGVTRITVYRYYPDKQHLVEAALMLFPRVLEAARDALEQQKPEHVETILEQIGAQFAALPAGDFPALLEELQRVYPQIWQQVHAARVQAIEGIFHLLFTLAEQHGRLRPDLNRQVVQAYFTSAVVNVLENPDLIALGLPATEVYQNVKNIFLYGLLKNQ